MPHIHPPDNCDFTCSAWLGPGLFRRLDFFGYSVVDADCLETVELGVPGGFSLAGLISLRDTGCRSPMAIQPEVEVCNSVADFSRPNLQELGSFALASPRGEGGGMTAENPGDLHGVEQLFHVSCAFW